MASLGVPARPGRRQEEFQVTEPREITGSAQCDLWVLTPQSQRLQVFRVSKTREQDRETLLSLFHLYPVPAMVLELKLMLKLILMLGATL